MTTFILLGGLIFLIGDAVKLKVFLDILLKTPKIFPRAVSALKYTPFVQVKCLRFSVIVHYNVVRAGMLIL